MKVVPFIAETLPRALARIHEQLGPEAFVLSVRPLPGQGLARLWPKSSRVEVLACIAEPGEEPLGSMVDPLAGTAAPVLFSSLFGASIQPPPPLHDDTGRPHVFIGPPGAGKTTLLCKWMTRSVLQDNQSAKVWRLDGATANTAEFLNLYAEMLAVPVERFWTAPEPAFRQQEEDYNPGLVSVPAELLLIDVPGVPLEDPQALHGLKSVLASLPKPRVHLVLNAAYEIGILQEQLRTFERFEPEDLSFCHLDELRGVGKLQGFLQGTNCRLRFLSTGQKIPGNFVVAAEVPVGRSEVAA